MKIIRHILFVFFALIAVSCSKADPEVIGPNDPKPSGPYIFFEPKLLDIEQTKVDLMTAFPTTSGTAFGVLGFYEDGEAIFDGYNNNIAKVYRDNLMDEFAKEYPYYDFASNKGYGTSAHISGIKEHGLCPIHRRTFTKNF